MTLPAIEDFRKRIEDLPHSTLLAPLIRRGIAHLSELSVESVAKLMRLEASKYFLLAAAGLNRTTLKKAAAQPAAQIVAAGLRAAHVVKERLPVRQSFSDIASAALSLRTQDLTRSSGGSIEGLFRERLAKEGIPILMSPPVRAVPGILIGRRKPDGVYPDPATGAAPVVYLEVKNVRRVSDDIQKRLYEIAEASLEMKLLYGTLRLEGLGLKVTKDVLEGAPDIRGQFREQIRASAPAVVALFLCPRAEAERYRAGAEAFIDRVFFQEEIEECLAFLREATSTS